MHSEDLRTLIVQGESKNLEFKEARKSLNKDVFESICAFLNRQGGHVVLGVKDNGTVQGIAPELITKIKQELVTGLNNPQILSPPFALDPKVVTLDGHFVIVMYVPESSQVHSTRGKVFARYEDGDLNITGQTEKISRLYLRKQKAYTENTVYAYVEAGDLRADLIDRARRYARLSHPNHPWAKMNDHELLCSARLYRREFDTGNSGYTLAAVLLVGTDEAIQNILPHYRIDGILRVNDLYRYDDRIDIRTNLLDAYRRLTDFMTKHLPDPFYLEGDRRVSVRNKIFREAIANLLVHREYTLANPSRVILEYDRVVFENANRPAQFGLIDPNHFTPHPKNPNILRFFREIDFSEELGSGIKNTTRYVSIYTPGRTASFIEDDLFTTIIPIPPFTNLVTDLESGRAYTLSGPDDALNGSANAISGPDQALSGPDDALNGPDQPLISVMDFIQTQAEILSHAPLRKDALEGLTHLLITIRRAPGENTTTLAEKTAIQRRTVKRYLKILKDLSLIDFKGSARSGGYYATVQNKEEINHAQKRH